MGHIKAVPFDGSWVLMANHAIPVDGDLDLMRNITEYLVVMADGSLVDLQPGSVTADATGRWTSPHTGAVYPSGWHLRLPSGERLELTPQLIDQELYFPVVSDQWSVVSGQSSAARPMAYWEGAVTVSGDRTGVGYVELTGYATAN